MKRLLSKALLSVFLEKGARDKVLGPDAPKAGYDDDDPLPERLIQSNRTEPAEVPLRTLSKQAASALGRAQADLDAPPPQKLQRAAETMDQRKQKRQAPSGPKTDQGPQTGDAHATDRQALIAQALAVQQQQSKKLDDLPPEDKLKLHLLARMALLGEDVSKK